jgi:LPS-assembly protein
MPRLTPLALALLPVFASGALAQPIGLDKLEVDPQLIGPRPEKKRPLEKPEEPTPPRADEPSPPRVEKPSPPEPVKPEAPPALAEPKPTPPVPLADTAREEPLPKPAKPEAPPAVAEPRAAEPETLSEAPERLSEPRQEEPAPAPEEEGIETAPSPQAIETLPPEEESPPAVIRETTIQLEAERVASRGQIETEAEGKVVLRQAEKTVYADWMAYNKQENEILARGDIRFEQRGDTIEGTRLGYKIDEETGFLEEPRFQSKTNNRASGHALYFEGPNKYRLTQARYTTCEIGEDDWHIRAGELRIDRERQVGTAHNAAVMFQGVPLLYTPWIDFPLNNQRKSGFLSPTFGTSDSNGIELLVPYYLNIAPNLDATIAPRLLSKRGLLLNNEFRYLEPSFHGEARVEVLPNDRLEERSRWAYNLLHNHNLGRGFSGYLNMQRVSDDDYFRDLSNQISATSKTHLLQEGGLNYTTGGWFFTSRVQRFQTLKDPLAPVVAPYERVPQLLLSGLQPDVLGADFNAYGEYVDFRHPTLITGQRVLLYPNVSYPFQTSYAYLTPKIGLHLTHYALDSRTVEDETRTLPIFSLDSGLIFERDTALFGERFVQTLEPRAYYVYIPFRDQNQIPVFDTALADFNLTQIFSENQFVGGDRVNDANQVTLGVTSRLLEPDSGRERLRATLAQRYYFESQQVTLPGVAARSSDTSDLLAAFSATLAPSWIVDAGVQYNTDLPESTKTSIGARYLPEPGKVLNASYRFTRDVLEQVDFSAQWPVTHRWTVLGRYNYSLREERLIEGLAGFEYNDGCWVLRLVAHRFVNTTQDVSNSVFVQLELGGISRIGSDPTSVLKQNIFGYRRVSPGPEPIEPTSGL